MILEQSCLPLSHEKEPIFPIVYCHAQSKPYYSFPYSLILKAAELLPQLSYFPFCLGLHVSTSLPSDQIKHIK